MSTYWSIMFRFESGATCSCFCSCLDFCTSFRVFLRAVFHQKVGNIPRQSTDIHQRSQSPAGQSQWCFSSISNSSIVIPCYVLGAWGMIRREWKLDLELLCHHAKYSWFSLNSIQIIVPTHSQWIFLPVRSPQPQGPLTTRPTTCSPSTAMTRATWAGGQRTSWKPPRNPCVWDPWRSFTTKMWI